MDGVVLTMWGGIGRLVALTALVALEWALAIGCAVLVAWVLFRTLALWAC